jgi:isopenicillin N synthase-like dioxygenase
MVHEAQRKLVQEMAAGSLGGAPPTKYVLREGDRPKDGVTAIGELEFPTVDLRRLADSRDVEETSKLRAALQSWGLFAVSGHGIAGALLDDLLAAARDFFHRPPEEKLQHTNVVDADGGGERFQPEGYGVDRVDSDHQVLDWCDRLYLQVEPAAERRLRFWPEHPPSFRPVLDEFTARCGERVARPVLGAMARALGFREAAFADGLGGGDRAATYARFTYYPPCPRPDLVNGVKPHTDSSVVTVLLLDPEVGGLQVLKDGEWVNVPSLGHDLLVIVGDEMEIMSNGVFRAPMHRVVTSSGSERVSLVMFYLPEPEKYLEPVAELVDEARPAIYRKLKADTFADRFFDAFAAGERAIDYLNLRVQQQKAAAGSS